MSNRPEGYHRMGREPEGHAASPVFQWRRAAKAMWDNSGEHTASYRIHGERIESSNASQYSGYEQVAGPITQKGNGGNAPCVVGVVHSTYDSGDSITSPEGRDHTRNTIVHNPGETHSRKGRRS